MRLLVDHNLPPRLATALHTIFEPDHEITALRDKFGRSDLKDEEWIGALGREGGWAVLSADMNIAKKKPSRDVFLAARLVGFFFSPTMQKWSLPRQAARFGDLARHGHAENCGGKRRLRNACKRRQVQADWALSDTLRADAGVNPASSAGFGCADPPAGLAARCAKRCLACPPSG